MVSYITYVLNSSSILNDDTVLNYYRNSERWYCFSVSVCVCVCVCLSVSLCVYVSDCADVSCNVNYHVSGCSFLAEFVPLSQQTAGICHVE